MPNRSIFTIFALTLAVCVGSLAPLRAQDRTLPYWASLRYNQVNMRVGPSAEYPIAWVYSRESLPVKVVRIREGWRLVEDHEGTQGWIAANQLNPARGALVIGTGLAELRAGPSPTAAIKWRSEPGVAGRLGTCRAGWCEVDLASPKQREEGQRMKGWIAQTRLWGIEALPGDE
ncbi:MAG: SH3 domain-containing protein [Erythrobacter sp.]